MQVSSVVDVEMDATKRFYIRTRIYLLNTLVSFYLTKFLFYLVVRDRTASVTTEYVLLHNG